MIGKARTGANFGGLQAYLLTGKQGQEQHRVAWVSTRNLPGDEPELAARVMDATAGQNSRVEKPVYHLTISLPPSERLSRPDLERIADTTLRDLGLAQHEALVVAHDDTDHQHVHVMVNRVHPETLKAWHSGHDYARIESSLRRQELELQLLQVPGRHAETPGHERHSDVGLSSGDRLQKVRTGHQSFAGHVRDVARNDLREASSWKDLHARLEVVGLHLKKRGRGVVVTDGDLQVKASFVDRGSSLPKLERRLGPYEPVSRDLPAGKSDRWRDVQQLREAARDLTRHQESSSRRSSPAGRTEQIREDSVRLERGFQRLFQEPDVARANFERGVARRGLDHAARTLATTPQRFGVLRGAPTIERPGSRILSVAKEVAMTARKVGRAPSKMARAIPLARTATGTLAAVVDAGRSPAGLPVNLARTAQRLVERLGWKLAARVVPLPQLQLLRVTVSLAKKTAHVILETARTVSR